MKFETKKKMYTFTYNVMANSENYFFKSHLSFLYFFVMPEELDHSPDSVDERLVCGG
jgi:hypothetical protein